MITTLPKTSLKNNPPKANSLGKADQALAQASKAYYEQIKSMAINEDCKADALTCVKESLVAQYKDTSVVTDPADFDANPLFNPYDFAQFEF